VFGDRLPLAMRFAEILASVGHERGLIGPHEVPRLWDRHLLNCAAITELVPTGARIVDVGSGAGLPGLVLAIRRSDLRVDLVESLRRRVLFLEETVAALDLGESVRVVRGRAEDRPVMEAVGSSQWVTARAVAPLDRLVRWCLPLLEPGGTLLAMKGSSAAAEVQAHHTEIQRLGGSRPETVLCGTEWSGEPVAVVVVHRDGATGRPRKGGWHERGGRSGGGST
jgi:16S rRNA (guanine527-N7)-methyltransferase